MAAKPAKPDPKKKPKDVNLKEHPVPKLSGNVATAAGDHRETDAKVWDLGTTQNTDEEGTERNPTRESTGRDVDNDATAYPVNS